MKYQVICQGCLLSGAKKKESIVQIQRITKLSEEQIRNSLLNGQPKTMFTSSDKAKVKKYGQAFRNAGLDIQIQEEGNKEPPKQPGRASLNKNKKVVKKRLTVRSVPR